MPTEYREFVPAETLHRLDDDPEFLEEMVEMLPEQTADGLKRLKAALQQRDLEGVQESAHRFKGSVAILSTGASISCCVGSKRRMMRIACRRPRRSCRRWPPPPMR